jgi:hypothetical protein
LADTVDAETADANAPCIGIRYAVSVRVRIQARRRPFGRRDCREGPRVPSVEWTESTSLYGRHTDHEQRSFGASLDLLTSQLGRNLIGVTIVLMIIHDQPMNVPTRMARPPTLDIPVEVEG